MSLIEVNNCDKKDSVVPDDEYLLYKEKLEKLHPKWSFSIVPGFFKQSFPETDDSTYNALDDHLGLADSLSWSDVITKVKHLNNTASNGEKYKLIFSARHGQGNHNLAIEIFGIKAWDEHYSHLEGAINPRTGKYLKWAPDPFLTEKGENQAKLINKVFKQEIQNYGCPIPTKLFSSPFTRSSQTLCFTLDGICVNNQLQNPNGSLLGPKRLEPIIKENLRETIGEHLCDKRSDKSTIQSRMKGWGFVFEQGFQHDDVYYKDDWREPINEQALRANAFLQDLFTDESFDNDEIVYCASHSGEMKSLIAVVGHRQYTVPTAGLVPMLVKGTKNY